MANEVQGLDEDMDLFGDDFDLEEGEGESESNDTIVSEIVAVEEVESVPQKTEVAGLEGLHLDFGSLESGSGIVVGKIGTVVSRYPVERLKFSKDHRTLLNVVSDDVVIVKTHYHEGVGNYICFNGECCSVDGLARVRYLLPVNVYDTSKEGKPVSPKLEPRVLSVGQEQYDDLRMMEEINGSLTGIAIMVSCKDEQYQKLSFQAIGKDPSRNNPKWRGELEKTIEFWNENFQHIVKSVARNISRRDYLKQVNEDTNDVMDEVDFDSVFK